MIYSIEYTENFLKRILPKHYYLQMQQHIHATFWKLSPNVYLRMYVYNNSKVTEDLRNLEPLSENQPKKLKLDFCSFFLSQKIV